MQAERWQRIDELFGVALDLAEDKRAVFLDDACAGDDDLRCEVEALLESHQRAGDFIQAPAFEDGLNLIKRPESLPGTDQRIGQYEVIREIGRGGMGTVYLAARADDQYKKQVAIKLIKRGFDTDEMRRQFRHERQILANLDHSNIARLIDGGTTEDGRPYLLMDYVNGEPITHYCDAHRLTTEERLKLFQLVCLAVGYAHRNLVIHRDIKPSNIIVTEEGTPKLLDFGIAKLLSSEVVQPGEQTATAARIMTPQYASPEQVRGSAITTATDIYSLGVLLYKLLTGHHPYQFKTLLPTEIERVICEKEPERPSAAITRVEDETNFDGLATVKVTPESVSDARSEQPDGLRRRLKGDLDSIVLMAIRKEPERRYSSVEQFSEDIRRHLEGLPVVATNHTFTYRASKFVRRNKVGVAASALVALALLGGTIATGWEARVARQERDRARIDQAKAQRINVFLQGMLKASDPTYRLPDTQKGREPTIKDALDYAERKVDEDLADQPEVRAALESIIGNSYLTLGRYDLAERHLRSALETQVSLYGEDHSEVVDTLAALAQLLVSKGDYAAAEPTYQRLIAICRTPRDKNQVEASSFAVILNDFALVLRTQGRFSEAESLLREGLGLAARIPKELQNVVGLIRTNLALVRADQGDFTEAESLYRAGIEENRREPGRENPDLAVGLTGLADTLIQRGEYAEAASVLLEAEAVFRRLLGDAHPSLATNLSVQGYLLYYKGDYAQAEKQINKSLEIFRRTVSEGHPRYTSSLIALGLVMNKTGRLSQAEATLRDALKIRTRLLPPGHYMIALATGALGECLITQKRYAEAEALLIESHDQMKTSQGERGIRTVQARQRLIDLYTAWKNPDKSTSFQALLEAAKIG